MISTTLLALLGTLTLSSDPTQPVDLEGQLPAHFTPAASQERHGRVEWFEGSYAQLLREAQKQERVVLLNFYTDLCSYCRVLDSEAYSDSAVVAALAPALCFSVDADSPIGRELNASYPTEDHYPALIFLNPDGSLRDRIIGYLPTRLFLPEVERIMRNEGTLSDLRAKVAKSPKDVNAIWALACKLEDLGDMDSCDEELDRIKKLDPQGKSLPMHHLALRRVARTLAEDDDDGPIRRLLAKETYPEILFEGWNQVAFQDLMRAKRAKMKGLDELAVRHRASYHESHLKAWANCPADLTAEFGNHVAWEIYLDWTRVDRKTRKAGIEVARAAVKAAPKTPEILDTLACLLFNDGQVEEAIEVMRRCVTLEPDRGLWDERLEMFETKES